MSSWLNTESFHPSELEVIDESNHVIFGSGGPIMNLLSLDVDDEGNEVALCEWDADSNGHIFEDGKKRRGTFRTVCLRRIVRFRPEHGS